MLCKDLKVVNLNITEDNYEYKALFRLCSDNACIDLDMSMLPLDATVERIKDTFGIEESDDEIRKIIDEKIIEASKLESRIKEGEDYGRKDNDVKTQRGIDSLSIS